MEITLLTIIVLIMSAIMHEYAHGWMAWRLGDNTAKDAGRLTLNPIPHLDLFGSIVLPTLLAISKVGFIFGWAKPVPYNPYNLRDQKYGELKVGLAGPLSNLFLAVSFGLLVRFIPINEFIKYSLINSYLNGEDLTLLNLMSGSFIASLITISAIICFLNLVLFLFNLIPVPPLDGSKVLFAFLPFGAHETFHKLEIYGTFIILALVYFNFFRFLIPIVFFFFGLITGL